MPLYTNDQIGRSRYLDAPGMTPPAVNDASSPQPNVKRTNAGGLDFSQYAGAQFGGVLAAPGMTIGATPVTGRRLIRKTTGSQVVSGGGQINGTPYPLLAPYMTTYPPAAAASTQTDDQGGTTPDQNVQRQLQSQNAGLSGREPIDTTGLSEDEKLGLMNRGEIPRGRSPNAPSQQTVANRDYNQAETALNAPQPAAVMPSGKAEGILPNGQRLDETFTGDSVTKTVTPTTPLTGVLAAPGMVTPSARSTTSTPLTGNLAAPGMGMDTSGPVGPLSAPGMTTLTSRRPRSAAEIDQVQRDRQSYADDKIRQGDAIDAPITGSQTTYEDRNLKHTLAPYVTQSAQASVAQQNANVNMTNAQTGAVQANSGVNADNFRVLQGNFNELQKNYSDLAKENAALKKQLGTGTPPKPGAPVKQTPITLPDVAAAKDIGSGGVAAVRQGKVPGDPTTQPSTEAAGGGDDSGGEPQIGPPTRGPIQADVDQYHGKMNADGTMTAGGARYRWVSVNGKHGWVPIQPTTQPAQ